MASLLDLADTKPGEPKRLFRLTALSPALIVLLLGGLALRLTIAYALLPSSGFLGDIRSFARWAMAMGRHGPDGFYDAAGFADYPPAYLYALWPVGGISRVATDSADAAMALAMELVKLPPMLIDVVVAYVIYRLVLGWAWSGPRSTRLALVAAALYLFNPVTLYDSALWGQADAAGALVILLGTAALIRGNSEGAAALAVVAALTKPQFGVVLIPLVALLLLKRHLIRPGSGPRHRPWAPASLRDWLSREQGPPRLLLSASVAVLTFFAIASPFGVGPLEYLKRMSNTADLYPHLSTNAFNLWAFFGSDGREPLLAGLTRSPDDIAFLGPLPAVTIGAGLLLAGYLWVLVRAMARDDRWTLLVAATVLMVFFFLLPTRVHERYLVPAFAILPILAVGQRRWLVALVLLSLASTINLHAVLTIPAVTTEAVAALPLGSLLRTAPFIAFSAALHIGVGLWAAAQLRPALATSPDPFDRESGA